MELTPDELVRLIFWSQRLCEWSKPLEDEECKRLEVGSTQVSMEIASVVILEASKKVLVELGEELCSIFDAELVAFVILEINKLEKWEH